MTLYASKKLGTVYSVMEAVFADQEWDVQI